MRNPRHQVECGDPASHLEATLVRAIEEERKRRGMTRAQLARGLGVAPPQISRRLNGETPMTVSDVGKLARLFGIPAIQLFTGTPPDEDRIHDAEELRTLQALRSLRAGLPGWELVVRVDAAGAVNHSVQPISPPSGVG